MAFHGLCLPLQCRKSPVHSLEGLIHFQPSPSMFQLSLRGAMSIGVELSSKSAIGVWLSATVDMPPKPRRLTRGS